MARSEPTRESGRQVADVGRSEAERSRCSRLERPLTAIILSASLLTSAGCSLFGSGAAATGDPLVDVNANDPAVVQSSLQLIRSRNEIRAVGGLIDNLDRDETQIRHSSFTTLVKLLTDNRFITYPDDVDPTTLSAKERADYVAYILYTRFGYSWGNPIDPARPAAVARWRTWYEEEGRAEIDAYIASGRPPASPSLMDLQRVPLPPAREAAPAADENAGTPRTSSDRSADSAGG